MKQNRDRIRDTRAGLERELNIMFENAEKQGQGRYYNESRGLKQGPNGRLDLNALIAPAMKTDAQRVSKLRITA